ncbi:MAG TPA: hypothetical protein VMV19_18755 [Xanthobacteraceae bacterium]|nr:hypothetical protein [Xanthobacteraceae bacterium]
MRSFMGRLLTASLYVIVTFAFCGSAYAADASTANPISAGTRILALGTSLIVLILIATAVTKGRPMRFLIGVDNRYSNSQCQLALWFGAVATVYLATVLLRWRYLGSGFIGGVGITQNLLAMTGLSAFSFGGAKVITAQKVANAPMPKPVAGSPNLLTDLIQNDFGNADLGDFQMILVTIAAVVIFVTTSFYFIGTADFAKAVTTLPDIDTTLLSGFGVGQGAYLIKKAALKPGEG